MTCYVWSIACIVFKLEHFGTDLKCVAGEEQFDKKCEKLRSIT
jgi:hypothetical protein